MQWKCESAVGLETGCGIRIFCWKVGTDATLHGSACKGVADLYA